MKYVKTAVLLLIGAGVWFIPAAVFYYVVQSPVSAVIWLSLGYLPAAVCMEIWLQGTK